MQLCRGLPAERGTPYPRRGDCRGLPAETKGGKGTVWFPCPLLTPPTLLRTRLPSVARLKARGPQGRLVLQGSTLDRSGAFRRRRRTPCTVWPRTVMRGKSRKLTSGSDSVPKSARRTEPSPRNPRFAARPKGVAARRKVWGVKRGQETIPGVLSPFVPAGEHRLSLPPKAAIFHRRGNGVFSAARRRLSLPPRAAIPLLRWQAVSVSHTGRFLIAHHRDHISVLAEVERDHPAVCGMEDLNDHIR